MKRIITILLAAAGLWFGRTGTAAGQEAGPQEERREVDFFTEPDTTTIVSFLKIDLNAASLAEIKALPGIDPGLAGRIQQYKFEHGPFTSIYKLMSVEGCTPADLARLKTQVKIVPPPEQSEITRFIAELQDRFASEENPGRGAINELEEYLLHPADVNTATIDQLLLMQNVSLVDAAAVVRHVRTQGLIKDNRTLQRNIRFLSHYGFTNLRNYVTVTPKPEQLYVDGNYRLKLTRDDRIDGGEENDFRAAASALQSALINYIPGGAPYDTMTAPKILGYAGWTPSEIEQLRARLQSEKNDLANPSNYGSISQRLVCDIGSRYHVGFSTQKAAYENKATNKGYVGMYDLGPFDKVFLGNYHLTVAQGLVMDNTDENMIRRTQRGAGLFGDITPSYEFAFRGLAAQASLWRLTPAAFYSDNRRDGILNRDGSINSYFVVNPRFSWYRDAFSEQTAGFTMGCDLSGFSGLPYGTKLGFTGFQSKYDKLFRPSAADLDLPGDKNELNDPNYLRQWSGTTRRVWGADFRTVVDNLSVESEVGKLAGGGWAYLWQARIQYETVYLLGMYRHYDLSYDNPYGRGFSEQVKFDDTLLEKDYRLLDPTYMQLAQYTTPKAEQGTYLETRWQINRKWTLTRAYVDFWQNLAWGLNNFRCQAEMEYRPVFPVRFRLKQKWQVKNLPKSADPTQSRTYETTLRTFCALSQRDNLNVEFRYGEVHLTPSVTYGSNMLMSGGYIAANWEHNFTPTWDFKAGMASWRSDRMSQWIFEDAGIDFLGGDGLKYYVTVSDRLTDNLQLKLRARGKYTRNSYAGIYMPESGYTYAEQLGTPVRDFTDARDLWQAGMQIDLRW
ncbi:MAG: helix-hairpin-helix domain-containing protein [Candidatus Edwardsbacteria bacterium]|nr:helix-hairpin-helix domain-containing protein [Candidatus Edwardsbacteria bacterium]